MPRNSIGTATNPVAAFSASALIKSADFNTINTDVYTELTNSIDKGGRTTPTANLPMGGYKHTGAAAATATGQYMEYDQVNTALALKTSAASAVFTDSITIPKTTGVGLKVDTAVPTFPWKDLLGTLVARDTGATAPSYGAFRGGVYRAYSFATNDTLDMTFHIPHDWVAGTDLYLHYHWAHNGTAISGNIVATYTYTVAKGFNQTTFPAEKTKTSTYATTNIATTPQYQHRIEEIQISVAGGSADQLDTAAIEVDSLLLVSFTMTTIPTITGGTPNEPFVLAIDIHYQSTGVGTKAKTVPFYV